MIKTHKSFVITDSYIFEGKNVTKMKHEAIEDEGVTTYKVTISLKNEKDIVVSVTDLEELIVAISDTKAAKKSSSTTIKLEEDEEDEALLNNDFLKSIQFKEED